MSETNTVIGEPLVSCLEDGEYVLWLTEDGKQSESDRIFYWLAYPAILALIIFATFEVLGTWSPDVTLIVKILLSIIILGWGLFVLRVLRSNHRQSAERLLVVTNQRLLVFPSKSLTQFYQSTYEELGSVKVVASQSDGLNILPRDFFSLNPFYRSRNRYNRWFGLDNPVHVKSLIDGERLNFEGGTM